MSLSKISARVANRLPESSHDISDRDAVNEPGTISDAGGENIQAPGEVADFQEVNDNEAPSVVSRMLNFFRELAIFCLIMITLEALTKSPPKVTKAPAAYPFFPKDSIVTDWYRGEISKAIEHARSSDISFVMFYAPWDAESQAARKEFEIVARYMQEYVTFAAINCWQPNSECRNQYSKVYKWPVLIAYLSHGRGVQYNGPISAPHIIRFLQKMYNPFSRLTNENIRNMQDAYVIVNVNTSPGSRDFAVLYTTALKYIEKDPLQCISFYVNSQAVSEPSLYLHLWNETLVYPVIDRDWRPGEILHWIFNNFHQVSAWVSPTGTKSRLLSKSLKNGPTLILFTPRNPLHIHTDYYSMLQEIGYEYYSCDNNVLINLYRVNVKLKRSSNLLHYKHLRQTCKSKQNVPVRKITSHLNQKIWVNVSNCNKQSSDADCNLLDKQFNYYCSNLKAEECIEFVPAVRENTEKICERTFVEKFKTSMLTGENDPRSPENLLKLFHRENCRHFLAAQKYQPAIFEAKVDNETESFNITGLGCETNRSLTFITLDSLLHYHFAERLGIDLSKSADKSAIVIVDDMMESHYIMKGSINSMAVREFLENFTRNLLPRSLESYALVKEGNKQNTGLKDKTKDKSMIFIEELNTNTFLPTVLQEDKAVIIFYYSKQCAFCSSISYVLLTVADKLSSVENLLFYRIDGEVNLLPWEYTMDRFPTILFLPTSRKSESRVFPINLPITVSNLIGFILTNVEPSLKLHAMWSICNHTKFEADKSVCFASVRGETLTLIDEILRTWRKSNRRQKQILLHKLKQLKQLHLLIGHSPQKHKLIQNYFKRLNIMGNSKDYHHSNEDNGLKDEL